MIRNLFIPLALLAALAFSLPAQAKEKEPTTKATEVAVARPSDGKPVTGKNLPMYLDKELAKQHKAFTSFARVKIASLNRNHRNNRARMTVSKLPDGRWKATFHEIKASSMTCQVRRSKSKTVPYVGVLSYKEEIRESVGTTAAKCRSGNFQTVKVIPNRYIFCYKNGWK